ncbi:MAG: sporulation protein YabP [Clostridia bacterium]|nr:sporulation protein YabP [Clostridia bacterium]MCI1958463.1 sporulation protein YabP [Clostridia bacterium]MCI1999826.1 sporulation protein YabP [Clostridia bacterium]MCI2014258.1 sporulation protein YabP [Clostridia bacterium]
MSEESRRNINRIVIDEREEITINGVEEVMSFDDESIICTSELGMIVIKGSELHIGKLSLEEGILTAQGMIESVSYEDEPLTGGGFFKKLFR